MDNFGIFKLLNSFYDFYQDKKSSIKEEPTKAEKVVDVQSTPPKSENIRQKPLQSTMLKTMEKHQEILARVLNNNPKK